MRNLIILSLCVFLAASCSSEKDAVIVTNVRQELWLDSKGLLIKSTDGSADKLIQFGSPKEEAVTKIDLVLGNGKGGGSNNECGAGPMNFYKFGALTLNFKKDVFVGWAINDLADPNILGFHDIKIGSTKQVLEEKISVKLLPDSSLGTEFIASDENGEIYGLLSGNAKNSTVKNVWAGMNCIFR